MNNQRLSGVLSQHAGLLVVSIDTRNRSSVTCFFKRLLHVISEYSVGI